ncbi:MAG: hypothetical protein [Wendovervirus sonii]|uniref:Baseplate wedge subunit n=1 Tax=phage Lak_Megaphage_Sonny TaxID=3109229 RepID=A0ABZ0Z6D4_9CAUD|nr:MAG: hypothetical protein [phage Lak_Megaphage_Sonny]
MNNITVKGANYNYAPGHATYAMDGAEGMQGQNGNNIFYTNISIQNDLVTIINQIKKNYEPLYNSTTLLNRQYQEGDIFFDNNGIIWQLLNYEKLFTAQALSNAYQNYFKTVGKIHLDNPEYISYLSDRLLMNTSCGVDIVLGNMADSSSYIDTDMPLNIVSNIIDSDGNIKFLIFNAIQNNIADNGDLQLHFNTNTKSFQVKSDLPVFIDNDIMLRDGYNKDEYDDYSHLLTSNDTITNFKNLCDNFVYDIIAEPSTNKRYVEISVKDTSLSIDDRIDLLNELINKDDVYLKIYDVSTSQYIIQLDNNVVKYNVKDPDLSTIQFDTSTTSGSIVGVFSYILDYNERLYQVVNQSKSALLIDTSIPYTYNYNINPTNASIQIASEELPQMKQIEFNNIYVQVGIYRDASSWNTKSVQTQSYVRSIPVSSIQTFRWHPDDQDSYKNYQYILELDKNNFDLDDEDYLGIQFIFNIAEISKPLYTVPLKKIGKLQDNKKYALYFNIIYVLEDGEYCSIFLNIEKFTDTLKSVGQLDPYNPVIDTEIPGYISDATKVSLMYNTEVFLQEKQYI